MNDINSNVSIDELFSYLEKIDSVDLSSIVNESNESSFINLIKFIFMIFSGKNKKFYQVADNVIKKIISNVNPWFTPYISEILCSFIENSERSQKEFAYSAFITLIEKNTKQITICMPTLVPIFSSDVNDVSTNVKINSTKCLELVLKCSGNADLDVFVPQVLKGLKDPSTIYDCVEALASCVFVQNVESPALSITTPILLRGLNDKKTVTKRKTCVIINNMCELIEHPKEILPFYERLKKLLDFSVDTISL